MRASTPSTALTDSQEAAASHARGVRNSHAVCDDCFGPYAAAGKPAVALREAHTMIARSKDYWGTWFEARRRDHAQHEVMRRRRRAGCS
eukprot:6191493-Pleurochrysis_carterae.AAC.3